MRDLIEFLATKIGGEGTSAESNLIYVLTTLGHKIGDHSDSVHAVGDAIRDGANTIADAIRELAANVRTDHPLMQGSTGDIADAIDRLGSGSFSELYQRLKKGEKEA